MADWLDGYFENKPIVDATVNPAGGGVVVEDGTITNAKLSAAAANTIKSNPTAGSLAPTDMTVAASRIVGRGPTGNLDDLSVGAGLTITDTAIGRPAFTGDVTASADSNALTIANDAVTTAKILDANVTTAKIALNAVGNQRMAQMATKTVKGNATTGTANSQDMTISGGLYTDDTSVLKSKSGIGWHYTFDSTAGGTPASGAFTFNDSTTFSSIDTLRIHNTTVGSRNIDTFLDTILNGRITIKSNNATGTSFGVFAVTGVPSGSDPVKVISMTPLTGVGVMPTNGEECVFHYEAFGSYADVMAVNTLNKVLRRDDQNNILDENGTVISGTATVTNYAALVALDTTTYADFAIKVTNGLNKSIWSPNGASWLPVNGGYIHDRSNVSVKKVICANQVTWSISNNGGFVRLSGTAHGLTAAANGYSLYATNTVTNWVSGTFHEVTYVDANTLDTTTVFTSATGTPTFGVAASTKIPVLTLTVPELRANSRYLFDCLLRGQTNGTVTTNRFYLTLGAVDYSQVTYSAASNETFPIRSGFIMPNSVTSPRGMYGKSSTGSAAGSDYVTQTLDMSTGTQVVTISLECHQVNFGLELANYAVRIEG